MELVASGVNEACFRRIDLLLCHPIGITKASWNTQILTYEVSFQEIARVLAKATLWNRINWLKCQKENIVIGEMKHVHTEFKGLVHRSRQHKNISWKPKSRIGK